MGDANHSPHDINRNVEKFAGAPRGIGRSQPWMCTRRLNNVAGDDNTVPLPVSTLQTTNPKHNFDRPAAIGRRGRTRKDAKEIVENKACLRFATTTQSSSSGYLTSAYKKTNERIFGCKIWHHTVTNTLQTFRIDFSRIFTAKVYRAAGRTPSYNSPSQFLIFTVSRMTVDGDGPAIDRRRRCDEHKRGHGATRFLSPHSPFPSSLLVSPRGRRAAYAETRDRAQGETQRQTMIFTVSAKRGDR